MTAAQPPLRTSNSAAGRTGTRRRQPTVAEAAASKPPRQEGDADDARDETTQLDKSSAAAPTEAAALLEHLQHGAQAAWRAAAEAAYSGDAEYESRRDTAVDVDDMFRDAMWQTFESGVRHPGEDVTTFARRIAEPDPEAGQSPPHSPQPRGGAGQAAAAGHDTAVFVIIGQARAGMPVDAIEGHRHNVTARLLAGAVTAEGQQFARSYEHTAAMLITELRDRQQPLAPVAATLPDGTPHADPFLAARGWQARGGVYVRRPQADLEAG